MSKNAKKSAKKPALKRSLLSHAVAVAAVAVGGFGQQAFAVDLCTAPSNTISALSPADECLLDTSGESLAVTLAGSLGQGVDATFANVTISNLGLIADDYTAIDFNSVGLDGSLTNTGTVEVDSGNDWAMGVYVRNNVSIGGTLNNSGGVNAVAVDGASNAYAYGIYVDGESTSTPWTDLNPATNATHYTSDYSYIGLESTGTLINSGTVSASAQVNTYWAYATGVNIGGAILGDITNSGTISATAGAWYGAYAHGARMGGGWIGTGDQTGSSSTVGEVNSTAYAYVGEETYLGLDTTASLANSGTISANADVSYQYAYATALYIDGVVQGSLDNSGTVSAEANNTNYYGAEARAVYLDGGDINTWSGSGSSSVDAIGADTSTNSLTTWASSWAELGLDTAAALTNSGSIEATAYSYGYYTVFAQALYIDGAVLGAVNNSATGSIVASAEADYDSSAYASAVSIDGGWIGNSSGTWNQKTKTVTSLSPDTYSSTSGSQTASVWSYIGLGAGAALTNAGTVQAFADAGNSYAYATGVAVDGAVLGSIDNSGSINAAANADDNYAFADAVALYGGDVGSQSSSYAYDYSSSTAIVSPTETKYEWSTATGTNYASENSYIGLGSAAALTNSGTISAAAHANWYYARANALTVDGAVLGSISNTGSISASAQAGGYNAGALGVGVWGGWIDSESQSWTWSDAGTATVVTSVPVNSVTVTGVSTTAWATDSAWSYIGLGSGASLSNSGTITVSADAYYSTARAIGVEIDGAVLGALSNGGTITVSAEAGDNYAYADGVAVYGGEIGNESYNESETWNDMWSSTVTVGATSTATVTAWASTGATATNYASEDSYIGLGSAAALTNSGTISVSADAGNYYARAEGLTIDGSVLGSIDNSGSIVASAEAYDSPNALGLAVYGEYISSYTEQESYNYNDAGTYTTTTNTLTLDVTTLGTSAGASATTSASASTWAETALGSAAMLTNSGTISATARAGQNWANATGVEVVSGAVLGQINNLGTISATAINDNYQGAYALGMQLGGGWIGSYDYSYSWSDSYSATSSSSPATTSSASVTNSASAWSYVSNEGYIGLGSAASLTNSGTISAAATVWGGGTGYNATATALYVNGAVQGAINNSGTISASASVDANGDGYYASALGLYLNGGSGFESESYAGTWSGATTVDTSNTDLATSVTTTAWAYNSASASAWASTDADEVALDLGASLTNSGTISATADAEYYDASAEALYIDGTVLGSIDNSGTITAEAEAGSYYAYANALQLIGDDVDAWSGSDTYTYSATATSTSGPLSYVSNYAWSSVSAGTWASDYSEIALGSAAALTNSGLISATAVSGYESASATALEIQGAVLGTVANTGTISATATADDYYADATAIYLDGDWVSSYSGSWNYTEGYTATTVGVITETTSNSAWATTYITNEAYVALGAGAALTNSGTIAATATAGNLATTSGSSASATAVRMYGAVLGAINNSGTISATAVAGYEDAYATGIYLGGGDVDSYSGDSTGTWSESSTAVSQSTSVTNWMTDESYVSLGTTGVFTNTGSVSASAEAGDYSASASALVLDGAMRGMLTNSGSITAAAVAGYYYAYATGVSLDGGDLYTENGTRTNGINAYTYDYARVSVDGTLVNDGVISADAEAGYSSAYADGVAIYGVIRGSVVNNGEITATATAGYDDAYAGGVYLGAGWVSSGNQDTSEGDYYSLANGGAFTNAGTISAFAEAGEDYASATGLYSWGQMAGVINNTGTIRASANVGDYDASAMGLVISGDVTGTITNSNAIAASADAGYYADAVALAVWGDVSGSIINTDSLGAYAGAHAGGAYAQGLYADHVSGTISNSGTVDVAADGGTGWASATGFHIGEGMSGTGNLTNTGYVGVLAESNDSSVSVYGVRVSGAMHDSAMVSNASGALISVQANGTGSESAYGVDLGMLFDNAQFVNAGDISVVSQSNDTSGSNAVVYGVHTDGLYDAAQLVNSGSIAVEQSAFDDALVVGLATGSIHNSAGALNSGTIDVSAAAQAGRLSATGIAFGSAYAGATMTNSGTITVQADGSSMFGGLFGDTLAANVQAVGISLDSQMVDSTLANTGAIKVTSNSSSGATTAAFDELFGSAFDFGGDASVYGIKAGLVDGASTISNSGSIVADATGSDNAAYGIYVRALTNGAMVVNTGTIDVDAGAGGDAYGIFVSGGTSGMVTNSGTISDGVYLRGNVGLNNTGSITNTASLVGGNYTQGVGGSLGFVVQDATDYGQIAVAGTADFTASNGVVVLLNPSDDLESGDVLADVVAAGTLTASAFDVSDNTLFWNFTPVIDGNTLDLTANYRGAAGVLANTGFNLSGSLAEVIDGIIDEGADGQYADLAAALNAAPDDAAAAALLVGFLPTLNGDAVDATRTATGGVSSSIDSRIAESRGAASGDAVKNGGVWLKTYFGMAEQDKVGNVNGFDVDSTGVVIGVDGDVTDAWRVGLAVGLSKAEVDAPLAQVDIDSNLFTLYGSYTVNDRTALDLTLGFGSNDYDSVRNAGTFGTASSTFDGDQLSFGANLSRTIKQGDKKVFIPSVSFQYLEVNVGGYSETGAGIMNQTVAAVDETSVSVLAKGTWEWTMANTGVFAAHLGLGFDSTDDAGATVTLAGNGPTYNVKGVDAEDVMLAAGLGYRYVTKKDLEIVVGYDLEAREDFMAGVAAVKFKMPF